MKFMTHINSWRRGWFGPVGAPIGTAAIAAAAAGYGIPLVTRAIRGEPTAVGPAVIGTVAVGTAAAVEGLMYWLGRDQSVVAAEAGANAKKAARALLRDPEKREASIEAYAKASGMDKGAVRDMFKTLAEPAKEEKQAANG